MPIKKNAKNDIYVSKFVLDYASFESCEVFREASLTWMRPYSTMETNPMKSGVV
jgi:hypothetical protein